MLADERLELGDELGVAAEREVGLDPLLECGQAQLLEARDLSLREGLGREVRKGRSAPKGEGGPQRLCCAFGLAPGKERSTLAEQALETAEVELLGLERQPVPVPTRLETPVEKRLAELRDVDMDAVEGARGRVILPERVDHPVRRDDLAGAQKQERQQRPLLARADLERAPRARSPRTGRGSKTPSCRRDRPSGLISARLKRCARGIQALLKRTATCSGRSLRFGRWDEHHERALLGRRSGTTVVGRSGVEPRWGREPSTQSEP